MPSNPITSLHNYLQGRHEAHLLSFEESSTGPSNKAVWTVICKVKGEQKGVGTGSTIAEAKHIACTQALAALKAAEQ
ncbi:hypothetical protein CPC08DRAFT_703048 [Agrocybe pediades]|nr:hypothetical protein CPC08DRAFT_703048 [Agrocybe pediades]